ncbi:MAG: helix-turn-helix transcriptional regulator [Lachnospiraceae bacterium]|nr:helix-turn-helix transcriptional regulator [Lachnospiraceae bacterium]
MEDNNIFSIKLKQLRTSLNMTQKEFSKHVGIRQQTLSGYERGVMKPSLDMVKDIAEKCKVSIDWLCGLSEKKNTSNELNTYSDIIDLLVNAENVLKFKINPGDTKCIFVKDSVIQYFFDSWAKMLPLVHGGTIDENLYRLWLEDTKKSYENIRIGNEDDIEDFLSVMYTIDHAFPDTPE